MNKDIIYIRPDDLEEFRQTTIPGKSIFGIPVITSEYIPKNYIGMESNGKLTFIKIRDVK